MQVALLGVVAIAVVCRLPAIGNVPLDFQATRQVRGAILARGFEVRLDPPDSPAEADAARSAANDEGLLEPPLLDAISGALWSLTGERFWIPRLLACLGYLCGGLALWMIADELVGRAGAWTTLGVYAFASYALTAATSFQPDPWLVGGMCLAAFVGLRWLDRPTGRRRTIAIATAAAVVFLKPIAAPVVLGGMLGARFARGGVRPFWKDTDAWLLVVIGVLPGALFLAIGTMTGAIPTGQASSSFIPSLLWTGSFWHGWMSQIAAVVTVPLFVVAVVALVAAASPTARGIGVGWLAGYVVFGLVVDYRISTHDYYSMPLLPIVALGLGVAVEALVARVPQYTRVVAASVVALLAIGMIAFWRDESAVRRDWKPVVAEYARMGEAIGHQPVIVLSPDSGGSFGFYGRLRFTPWPSSSDLHLEHLQGASDVAASKRLDEIRSSLHADVFVVTALAELDAQPDLKAILDRAEVLYRSPKAAMFALPPRP